MLACLLRQTGEQERKKYVKSVAKRSAKRSYVSVSRIYAYMRLVPPTAESLKVSAGGPIKLILCPYN